MAKTIYVFTMLIALNLWYRVGDFSAPKHLSTITIKCNIIEPSGAFTFSNVAVCFAYKYSSKGTHQLKLFRELFLIIFKFSLLFFAGGHSQSNEAAFWWRLFRFEHLLLLEHACNYISYCFVLLLAIHGVDGGISTSTTGTDKSSVCEIKVNLICYFVVLHFSFQCFIPFPLRLHF